MPREIAVTARNCVLRDIVVTSFPIKGPNRNGAVGDRFQE